MSRKTSIPTRRQARFTPSLTGHDYPQVLIDRVVGALCPPVLATVDMSQFIRLLLGSYSLDHAAKVRVVDALPTLSQYQCDALQETWEDELQEFKALVKTEWPIIAALGARAWVDANQLAHELGAGYSQAQEQQARAAMLQAKYNTPAKRGWLDKAVLADCDPLTAQVFGVALAVKPTLQLPHEF